MIIPCTVSFIFGAIFGIVFIKKFTSGKDDDK